MEDDFLTIKGLSVAFGNKKILDNIHFSIKRGQQWALIGQAGSGKTVFAHTLNGRYHYQGSIEASFGSADNFQNNIHVIEQRHHFRNIYHQSDFYYQQRFNSFDSEMTITVQEELSAYPDSVHYRDKVMSKSELIDLLHLRELMKEPLIQLSNGENKRLQLVKGLLQNCALMILDQPFTGLDTNVRNLFSRIMNELSGLGQAFLLITSADQLPDCITHIATLDGGRMISQSPRDLFIPRRESASQQGWISREKLESMRSHSLHDFEYAVRMVGVNVQYGDKSVLKDINWQVAKSERWSLSGPNGAGKSTLLSLINGDNPQAYANEIYLFDRRRGSGESIWDIKQKIGYISPELHLYFDSSANIYQTIASGLFDTIGLFRRLDQEQENRVHEWLDLSGLRDRSFQLLSHLSLGEQRMALLARALIKTPPLLILDEPCQGLDNDHKKIFKSLIDLYCDIFQTTLIYVSHYEDEIPASVNKFLRLEQGVIKTFAG
ncbi:MAG: ABC transporter [Bacteroidetes bacterium]|nr:MAG: ABC transporter [Bacteroidota bacterium]